MSTDAKKPRVAAVVAMSRERRAIGVDDKLLWHIPEDLRRFKKLTRGHPVIMGRKTFESILGYLGRPLPERVNIVITKNNDYAHDGVIIVHSLEEGLEKARELDDEEVHIGGGTQLYEQALPHIDRLYLTIVDDEPRADSFFPDYSEFNKVVEKEKRQDPEGPAYEWVTLERS